MAYTSILARVEILRAALVAVETSHPHGISLRAVATALGVKAPSLYRYFPQKEALEVAVAEEVCRMLLVDLQGAAAIPDAEDRFLATAESYLRFARERFALYAFVMERVTQTYGLPASKAVWNLLQEAASGVSLQGDDTAAAVATWSLLHGYAMLEHSGAFGASGPRGGLERGLTAFLAQFPLNGASVQKVHKTRRRSPKP